MAGISTAVFIVKLSAKVRAGVGGVGGVDGATGSIVSGVIVGCAAGLCSASASIFDGESACRADFRPVVLSADLLFFFANLVRTPQDTLAGVFANLCGRNLKFCIPQICSVIALPTI